MDSDRSPVAESIRRPLDSGAQINLRDVTRSFQSRTALLPITLKIQAGEFVSLLGPSGSGKSTLLRMIAGLERTDSGTVQVSSTTSALAAPVTSFVFQESALLPWRTVRANVSLPLELAGVERSLAMSRAREALAQVRLSDAVALYPNQLSGGMKMRVSVARAMVSKPSLLLLDEPFASLDERARFKLQEDLRELWLSSRMTVLFVTHSVSEAIFVSNRAIVLSEGPGRILLDHPIDLGDVRPKALRTESRFQREVEILNSIFEEPVSAGAGR